jgi:large subunit ribosomal protein L5
MDITFVTTAGSDDEGRALLRHLGFPFKADADVVAKAKKKGRPAGGKKKK